MSSLLSMWVICFLLAVLCERPSVASEVVATIADKKYNETEAEVHARFHWKDIFVLGSHYEGVAVHETDQDHWSVKAPLAFAFPNDGSHLKNAAELAGNIAIFKRSHDEHVLSAQPYKAQLANAKAVILVDFPESFEKNTALWAAIYSDRLHRMYEPLLQEHTIPTVIISLSTFERMKAGLDLAAGDLWTQDGMWEDQHLLRSSRYAHWLDDDDNDEL